MTACVMARDKWILLLLELMSGASGVSPSGSVTACLFIYCVSWYYIHILCVM